MTFKMWVSPPTYGSFPSIGRDMIFPPKLHINLIWSLVEALILVESGSTPPIEFIRVEDMSESER